MQNVCMLVLVLAGYELRLLLPSTGATIMSRPNRLAVLFVLLALTAPALPQPAPVDYLAAIRTAADFELVSLASQLGGEIERTTKFLLPASSDPELLGPLFQNVNTYRLHIELLRAVFPERFPNLTEEEYQALVERRATRKYFAGILSRLLTPLGVIYGFSVFTEELSEAELLRKEEVKGIYEALLRVFDLGPLYYAPESLPARLAARDWQDPGFPVYLGGAVESKYQAYTRAVGYGRVRILTLEAFDAANDSGRITWQDVLVLARAPRDIEGVVAGVITAEPQGELSHIAIRTARRGTPNAFLADALEAFKPLEGRLVRLEVGAAEYSAVAAPLEDAERWWVEHRPRLSETPAIDADYAGLDALEEMDLSGASGPPEARFGGKATNFARLQRILTGPFERYRERAFGIPMRHYLEFLRANRIESALRPGPRVTFEKYLAEIHASGEIQSDPERRFEALRRFREEAEESGVVDSDLVAQLARRIDQVFGSTEVPVRLRSSSNVEDSLEFNGAGLYESTSACAADDLDDDGAGPSRCDPDQEKERRIARALRRVWSSLWTFRAYEERSYYQIPQEKAAMAVLVSSAFRDEKANGVAFTGNPSNIRDRRYVVTAQAGEESVVSPDPDKTAEKDLLEVENGAVKRIERAQRSSLVPAGEHVLSEAVLKELGAFLWHVDRNFPVDLAGHRRDEVLLDLEFKLEADGTLAVKQTRPFLVTGTAPDGPTFELEVPAGTVACGVFVDGRDPRGEHEAKSQVRFVAGMHALPAHSPVFEESLIGEVLFGPGRVRATSLAPGRFRLVTRAQGNGDVSYGFSYEETFALPGGTDFSLEILNLDFDVRRGVPPALRKTLDEAFLTDRLVMVGVPGGDRSRLVRYASCSYETLPLWDGLAEMAGGDVVRFEERFRVPEAGSGPANLMAAAVTLGGVERDVRDYWELVYAAQHHNVRVKYWILLDPPIPVAGVGEVHVVELSEPQADRGLPAQAAYLAPSFEALLRPAVVCYQKRPAGQLTGCGFRRGDASSSGRVDLTDAVFTLLHLVARGPAPPCEDAADFNDDGVVEITDAILVLTFLFRGVDLSAPPGPFDCGPDPTGDALDDCRDETCR